jgi:hypothetical protein
MFSEQKYKTVIDLQSLELFKTLMYFQINLIWY